jgi:hypothetical protein
MKFFGDPGIKEMPSNLWYDGISKKRDSRLFDSHGLGQVTRLIHIQTAQTGNLVGQ